MKIDLHTHSQISDGTDSPAEVVEKAQATGLDVIALTDHDTFDGIGEAQDAGRRFEVSVVCGIELSTTYQDSSIHLLGYGCDPKNDELNAELEKIRHARTHRVPKMVQKLSDLGLAITLEDVARAGANTPAPGRPHIADALIAKGYVANREQAFSQWLAYGKPAYVPRYAVELGSGIDLIHGARGVAVIAHPWGRDCRSVMTPSALRYFVEQHGLDGIEVDHPEHDEQTRAELSDIATRLGLVQTGSSDYHGTGKTMNPLGACLTNLQSYRDLLARIEARGGHA